MMLSSSSGSGSGRDAGVGGSPKMSVGNNTSGSSMLSSSVLSSTAGSQAVSGRSGLVAGVVRRPRTHAVVITGPPGAGKSSLVLAHQAKWRGKWFFCTDVRRDSGANFVVVDSKWPVGPGEVPRVGDCAVFESGIVSLPFSLVEVMFCLNSSSSHSLHAFHPFSANSLSTTLTYTASSPPSETDLALRSKMYPSSTRELRSSKISSTCLISRLRCLLRS